MKRKNPNKICSCCKKEKPISEFWTYNKKGTGKIGVSSKCKMCHREYNKEWWKGGKGKELKARYHKKIKLMVLDAYSKGKMECACCGEKEVMFLTIDHIDNDGAKERKKLKISGGNFYRWLVRNNFPNKDKYQVLCFNCNQGRQLNGGICPHKQ